MAKRKMSGAGTSVVHMERITDRMVAAATSKVAPVLAPWVVGGALVPASWATAALWGDPASLPWAASGMTLSTVVLTGTTAAVTHARGMIGRVHSTLTTALACGWVTVATITGPVWVGDPVFSIGVWGGCTLAATWSLRKMTRTEEKDFSDLPKLWEEIAEKVNLLGSKFRTKHDGEHKTEGRLELVPGAQTPKDAQQAREKIASGLRVAPTRITITPDEERGDWATMTVVKTDIMKNDLAWHAQPRHAGASIADAPLDAGLYADGEQAGYSPLNTHVQIMGMSGSAKSFGAGWNIVGDAITRSDVAVLAADATKGRQTLGPLEEALHKCETTQKGAQRLLQAVHRIIKPRTDYLSQQGLAEWQPECGLKFVFAWLEEAPDMFDEADIAQLLKIGKAARSAGIHLMVSLQRATWDQIPTTLRGQLATKICLGVESSDDARHGLPAVALDAGAEPERWADRKPGAAYLVSRGIEEKRYAMPLRHWRWTTEQMRTHAAAFPATARPLDQITINADPDYFADLAVASPATAAADQPGPTPEEVITVTSEQVTQPKKETREETRAQVHYRDADPNPDLMVNLNDEIEEETNPISFDVEQPRQKMTPEQGQQALDAHLLELESQGELEFAPRDLYPLVAATGFQRTWLMNRIKKLVTEGRLEHRPESGTYRIITSESEPVPA